MTDEIASAGEDAAWATIETPYSEAELRCFLDDVERLFRINSLLVFEHWETKPDGGFRFRARNQSNGQTVDVTGTVTFAENELAIRYDSGLKTATTFRIEPGGDGAATLVLTDDYAGTPSAEREARMDEVDRSLVQWARDLHRYLWLWRKWAWLPGWRFYMRRVWQPMRPVARRIAFALIMITLVEFIMFLFVFVIFWFELDRYLDL